MDDEYPFLSEESYERKNRRHAHAGLDAGYGVRDPSTPDDPEALLALVDECDYLSPRQKYVVRGVLMGKTLTEIAREYGVTKQAMARTFARALQKIQLKSQLTPYDAIGEVYGELTRRGQH